MEKKREVLLHLSREKKTLKIKRESIINHVARGVEHGLDSDNSGRRHRNGSVLVPGGEGIHHAFGATREDLPGT
jgi:hypothetical protein